MGAVQLQGGHMAVSLSGDFKANLAQLPDVDGIESITLTFKDTGERCDVIENKPGKSGSVKVYNYLLQQFPGGEITRQAAYLGVAVYAEHVEDSHTNPGKHPNIDRLFNVINSGRTLC